MFTVAFFGPFSLPFFSDFIQYRMLELDFLDLHPFCMLKLKRGKNPEKNGGNTKNGEKRVTQVKIGPSKPQVRSKRRFGVAVYC
jgi:hypothetical protein